MKEKITALLREKRSLFLLAALLAAVLLVFPSEQEGMTQEERRIAQILSQTEGSGRVEVTVYYSESAAAFGSDRRCVGALAVCEGAGDIAVRINISRALETLLGLEAKNVVVLKMEDGR